MDLKQKLEDYLTKEQAPGKIRDYFHLSEIGKSKKEIYESMRKPESRKTDATLQRIFDNGNYMHSRYYKYLAEMKLLVAAEIDVVNNDLFHGRADGILTDGKDLYVLDLKSMNQFPFANLKEAVKKDVLQIQFYMYYLNIPKGILLYENKNNQDIKTFIVELDKNMVEKVIEEFKKLKEIILQGLVPEDKPITVEEVPMHGV